MIGLLLLAQLVACEPETPKGVEETVESTSPEPYVGIGHDVIVIVLDTLRADHLAQYGYALDTSPELRALAAKSTRFDNAWAPAPWTLPSSTTIHTGLHPLRHGLRRPGDVLGDDATPLAERLRTAGWRTAGFSHNANVNPRHGFAQGFDRFTANTTRVNAYPNVARMTHAASDWITNKARGPAFVYLQPMNCHGPYRVPDSHERDLFGRPPKAGFRYYQGWMKAILTDRRLSARARVNEAYLTSLQEQYDAAIRYETDVVGGFLHDLTAAGRFEDALIILTADHGEELFDHGGFSHGYSLYREVLHVPLLVKLPGQATPRVVPDDVTLMDIVPTVLEVTGVAPKAGESFDGTSLVGLAKGEPRSAAPVVVDVGWDRAIGRALIEGDWKFIHMEHNYEGLSNASLLFNRVTDPTESTDLAAAEPARVAAMHERLTTLEAGLKGTSTPTNTMTAEDRKQLEALGYLE